MNIQYLPLSKLVPSPDNVRKTGVMSGIEQLAASIEAHGLLQNLQAKPASKGTFEVVAGSRRHAALKLMAKQKKIEADHPVPCHVLDGEDATEISLAENEVRASHASRRPVRCLQGAGRSRHERRGYSGAVRRNCSSCAAAAEALARQPEIDRALPQGRDATRLPHGFCHRRRPQAAGKNLERPARMVEQDAHAIRDAITEAHIDADCKLARFVTVDAYQAAGGAVLRDLFDTESARAGFRPCPAQPPRSGKAGTRSGKHSRPRLEMGRDHAGRCVGYAARLRPRLPHADRAATGAIDELQAERDKLDEDEDSEKVEQLMRQARSSKARIAFTAEEKATSGAIVTIDAEGELEIISGLVRREDRAAAKKKKAEAANGDDDNAPPCFSAKLIEDLTAHRTAAFRRCWPIIPRSRLPPWCIAWHLACSMRVTRAASKSRRAWFISTAMPKASRIQPR